MKLAKKHFRSGLHLNGRETITAEWIRRLSVNFLDEFTITDIESDCSGFFNLP